MAISVTAGPDYLEGPINRPHCVALELQKTWWGEEKKNVDRGHGSLCKFNTDHMRDSRWCISYCNAPLEMRICQNFSGC